MARIVIPGGTGYLGQALTERLVARGDEVVLLTRGPARQEDGWRAVHWDAPAARLRARRSPSPRALRQTPAGVRADLTHAPDALSRTARAAALGARVG